MSWIILVWLAIVGTGALIVLDFCGKLPLTRFWFQWIYLAVAPHAVMCCYLAYPALQRHGSGRTAAVLLLASFCLLVVYVGFRLHFAPWIRRKSDTFRLRAMLRGRALILLGIYALLVQIPLCIAECILLPRRGTPPYILAADVALAALAVVLLLANGVLRILFTSRRLSVWRRVLILLTIWVPLINLTVLLYCCRVVLDEYDHECYKVVNRSARVDSDLCRTRYPLVLVHGVGFRDLKYFNYWGRIPKELIRNGATVYYGHQEAWGTIEANAAEMKENILEILRETGCEKVNIIAHSKGGLDSRYLISALGMGDRVASLTTMSTPHRGSLVIDKLLRLPDGFFRWLAKGVNAYFRRLGDHDPDFYHAVRQFSTPFAAGFNRSVPDRPEVFYQSYTSVMGGLFSDSLLCFPYSVVKAVEGENDGLVSIESAKWGEFRGVFHNRCRRGISHGDIIDLKREDYRGFDVVETYVQIVSDLKKRGF
ncbi:triacylglycerol lipase [Clostridiaceae bacterium NSJ-31]|uniref:Triacylglycerol lipase n=1 Tax=Ligaoa zhengdingensis TaxID=2763658 RepID=A0A926I4G6_9FIRM|nr:triacylglycerol lipase [Ligaoa zhengdingensis]MBC8547384.1 triacylglycerol lipase [Ligaoa zhengdingensis]